ncbi:MAG: ferrous iron transporter B [Chitinispirillaceae bacterium]|nr:ferrous iron transporter B [Chitinispirillaceae bacterium]
MNMAAKILINRVIHAGLFLAATWLLFNVIFFLGTHPSHWLDILFQWLAGIVWRAVTHTTVRDFLIYGLITGVGGFLVYVPNIVLLFLFSHLLFDTGFSALAARMVRPLFRLAGLDGSSFQPLLFGFGCSVTAIHGAGFIKNERNRLLTMLISNFMSCGSKFGVYVLLISFIFGPSLAGTVLFGLYVLGIAFAVASSFVFRALLGIKKEELFEEPLPVRLKRPDLPRICRQTVIEGWNFCKKAGSIIVIASLVIWALSYWPGVSEHHYGELQEKARLSGQELPSRAALSYHASYAAAIGRFIEPAFRPLGQNWKTSIALVTGVAGRTTIISTLLTLYGIEYSPDSRETLTHAFAADPDFSRPAAFAMMIFVLLCGSCLASVMMFFDTTKSFALTGLFLLYPVALAWLAAAGVFSLGSLFLE